MSTFLGVGGFILLVVFLIIVAPLVSLWGLNTISEQAGFGWYVPHNVWTYLSVYALAVPFGRSTK